MAGFGTAVKALNDVKHHLRAVGSPTHMPGFTRIGMGTQRDAYGNGVFVVKLRASAHYDSAERERVAKRARTVRVGDWEIQRQYEPLVDFNQVRTAAFYALIRAVEAKLKAEHPAAYDIINSAPDGHVGNFGRDHKGRLVQFDW